MNFSRKLCRLIGFLGLALVCFSLDVAAQWQPLYIWDSYNIFIDRSLQFRTSCWQTCIIKSNVPISEKSKCNGYPDDDRCVKDLFNALRAFAILSSVSALAGVIVTGWDWLGKLSDRAGRLVRVAISVALLLCQTSYWAIDLHFWIKGCGPFGAMTDHVHSKRQASSALFMVSTGFAALMLIVAALTPVPPARDHTNNKSNDDGELQALIPVN